MTLAQVPDSLRLRRGAEHLHALGPRAVAEMLAEVGRVHGVTGDVLERLEAWRRLRPETLAAVLGGRQFPPAVQAAPQGIRWRQSSPAPSVKRP